MSAPNPPRYSRAVYTSWTPSSQPVFDRLEVSDDGKMWRTATEDDRRALGFTGTVGMEYVEQ